ncbi:MAG: conjugal transfer protein TrbI, partial [Rhizobiaceae bacterium]|nr:conjugal transfer protein TrbI [Rhizobiaceae bacterium]
MSDSSKPITPKIDLEDLEIRAKPRPVTRINRRVLYLLSGTGLILIFGATIFALNPPSIFDNNSGGNELYNIDNRPSPDGLEGLPRKYSDLSKPPELGSPLPGDLGSAILKVERDLGIQPTPALPFRPNPVEDAERAERIRQARLAQQGRESGVFFQLALRNSGALPDTSTKLA